jgi:hypothetical protein
MQVPDFLTLFTQRREHFFELLQLSKGQLALVEADDHAQLLTLLGAKQRIIGRLEELGQRRPDMWQEWRRDRDRLLPDARRSCEETLAETETLLAELLENERVSTETLARRRDATQRELRSVMHGSRVNQEYRDSLAPATHRHLDVGN